MDKLMFSFKGIKPVLALLVILTMIQAAMLMIQSYFLAGTISSLFRGDLFYTTIIKLACFFIAFVLRQLISVAKNTISFHYAAKTSEQTRAKLLEKVFQLGPHFVEKEGSGQTVTLVMEGVAKFQNYLELYYQKLVNLIIIPVSIVLFIWFEDVRPAGILLLTLPILISFLILLGWTAKSKANQQFESFHLLSNHFVDSLRGLETLKYLGISNNHINNIRMVSERYRQSTMGTLKIAFLSSLSLDFFTMLSIATVAVFLGLGLINGAIVLSKALMILILAPEYFLPIREFGTDYHATLDGKKAGNKIHEILNLPIHSKKEESIPKWDQTSTLSINGLNLKTEDNQEERLKDIQFSTTGFRKIGIVGQSGSGKSTLIQLLSGFLEPTTGEFEVNGKKLTSLAYQDWQCQLTYIPQHPYLFHDSVLNNVRFYQPSATREEVENAIKKAGLTTLVHELPQGIETIIGDGGSSLSGGQEQRIALARAFLGDHPVILLDEPTAHLDIETEAELKETMLPLFNEKLVFFSTHRMHWMLEMDQIMVLNHGKIVELGTHEQLIERQSVYLNLFKKGDLSSHG